MARFHNCVNALHSQHFFHSCQTLRVKRLALEHVQHNAVYMDRKMSVNRNCLCQFREIPWNQTTDDTYVQRGSILITRVIT